MKTFAEGIDELKRIVGQGDLVGEIRVDQVYAHYQDSGFGPRGTPASLFAHPRGGQAGYLSRQVVERRDEVIESWAAHLLRGDLSSSTVHMLRSFADQAFLNAPREFWILRNSVSTKLTDDGVPTHLQPALMPRLSQAELNAIRKASGGDVTRAGQRQRTTKSYAGALTHDLGRPRSIG